MSRRGYIQDLLGPESRTDIYLGVVAPTGIPRTSFVSRLRRLLDEFGYDLEVYRLSDYLRDYYPDLIDSSSEHDRLRTCMDAGSRLREEHEDDALVTAALIEVAAVRALKESHEDGPRVPRVHLFWSLKHPGEVAALRAVYGRGFHLIGLFAPKEDRVKLLLDRDGISRTQAREHIERDQAEQGRSHGQQTRKTFQHADVFLEWGAGLESEELERFLDLVFGNPLITPRESEHWMFLAYANSVRAGELSRQVGAALVSREGDLLGLGANDAPRRRGGLYWPDADDDRDCARKEDANSVELRRMLQRIVDRVVIEPHLGVGARRYLDYFSMHLSSGQDLVRKNADGTAVTWERSTASPRTPLFPRSHVQIEREVASLTNPGDLLTDVEGEDSGHGDGRDDD